jgi:hypothetical protein
MIGFFIAQNCHCVQKSLFEPCTNFKQPAKIETRTIFNWNNAMTETVKKQRGGKREGSGAKPKAPTTAIRIDNRLIDLVSVIKSSYTNGIIDDGVIVRLIDNNLNLVQDSSVTPAPELKISKSKLKEHQDKLVNALIKHFGDYATAKIQLAAYLGIKPERLIIGKFPLAEIVDIWEWLSNEPAHS